MSRKLPTLPRDAEGLGRPTIMSRPLAAAHGAPYVRLAAFAIDVDRIREVREESGDELPFGWEVFLTESYLLERLDVALGPARALVEDAVAEILEGEPGEAILGGQLPFAVWDAISRGAWPAELRSALASWRARPDELVRALAPLWADAARHRRELARACLETAIAPPLSPPTLEALRAMAGTAGA